MQRRVRAAHLDSGAAGVGGAIGGILTVAMAATASLMAHLYDLPQLAGVRIVLSVIPFMTGISSVPESILRRQLKFRYIALRVMSSMVLSVVIGVASRVSASGRVGARGAGHQPSGDRQGGVDQAGWLPTHFTRSPSATRWAPGRSS